MNEKEILKSAKHPFIVKLDYIFQTVNLSNKVKLPIFRDGVLSRRRFFHPSEVGKDFIRKRCEDLFHANKFGHVLFAPK